MRRDVHFIIRTNQRGLVRYDKECELSYLPSSSSSLSYSFNKYLLSRYYIPGIVLAIQDTALKNTKKGPKKKINKALVLSSWGATWGTMVAVKCTGYTELSNTKISHRRLDILKRNKLTNTHKISH